MLVDNVEQVTLKMISKDEPSVTFKRQKLEKIMPHTFKDYKSPQRFGKKILSRV
ncbi:hypothetical protein ABEP10_15595 [Bacillus pumilus]